MKLYCNVTRVSLLLNENNLISHTEFNLHKFSIIILFFHTHFFFSWTMNTSNYSPNFYWPGKVKLFHLILLSCKEWENHGNHVGRLAQLNMWENEKSVLSWAPSSYGHSWILSATLDTPLAMATLNNLLWFASLEFFKPGWENPCVKSGIKDRQ